MIAVAIAGMTLAGVLIRLRQIEYQRQAASFRALEVAARTRADWMGRMAARGYVSGRDEAKLRSRADQYARLKTSYEGAAARPWTSVAPGSK